MTESLSDNYDISGLGPAMSAKWMTSDTFERMLRSIQMESDGVAWFQVKYGGETIMSSAPGSDRWPGCRISNTCSAKDPAVRVFDTIFRAETGALPKPPLLDDELALIRWRVEGALWTLGALVGKIPDGLYFTRLPVADFTNNALLEAPIPTIYGSGKFVVSSGGFRLDSAHDTFTDVNSLGDVWQSPANAGSMAWNQTAIPRWVRNIYMDSSNYLHARRRNVELTLVPPKPGFREFVQNTAKGFESANCGTRLEGPSARPHSEHQTSYKALADLRSSGNWGKLCFHPSAYSGSTLWIETEPDPVGNGKPVTVTLKDQLEMCYGSLSAADPLVPYASKDFIYVSIDPYFCHGFSDCPYNFSNTFLIVPDVIPGFDKAIGIDYDLLVSALSLRTPYLYTGDAFSVSPFCTRAVSSNSGMTSLTSECMHDEKGGQSYISLGGGNCTPFRYTHRMLRPAAGYCSAGQRVPAFVNSYPPTGVCGAASQFNQAVVLACELAVGGIFTPPGEPPAIETIEQIPVFSRWVASQAAAAQQVVTRLYLENVPSRVVDDINKGLVGTGSKDGSHGQLLLEMRSSVIQIESNWQRVATSLSGLKSAIDMLHVALIAANIEHESTAAHIAIARMQIHQQMIAAGGSGISGFFSSSYGMNQFNTTHHFLGAIVNLLATSAGSIYYGLSMLAQWDKLEGLAGDKKANDMNAAFVNFEAQAQIHYADMANALQGIQSAVASTLSLASQLRQNQADAQYEAAKAAGEPFVVINNQKVPIPVNSVLNAQYDITKQRYRNALREAKYLAYVARLAIEQRIGMRLNSIAVRVGPLEAPATWADDVCSMDGVDYESMRGQLSSSKGDASATLQNKWALFFNLFDDAKADLPMSYIGDYVEKLGNFVDYYNVQYPSHDGDDTAVLSLREDFLPGSEGCIAESPNLLYFSDQLEANGCETTSSDEDEDSEAEELECKVIGWFRSGCGTASDRCLVVDGGDALPEPDTSDPLFEPLDAKMPPELRGGISWLHENADTVPYPGEEDIDPVPPRVVWQAVSLEPGTYVLSWRDQARSDWGFAFLARSEPEWNSTTRLRRLVSTAIDEV